MKYQTASNTYNELAVKLYDAQGKSPMKQNLKGENNAELIGLKNLKAGRYSVNLIADRKLLKSEKLTVLNK